MATIRVSGALQLRTAIRTADGGDTIKLQAGNYGNLTISGISRALTITSESGPNPAVFDGIAVRGASNLTLEGLRFTGAGNGVGVNDSKNITIRDSTFIGNTKGIAVNRADDITILNNDFTRMRDDAMALSGVDGARITGNQVRNMKTDGGAHHDMIQIHPTQGASRDFIIRNNILDSNDTSTQAIYIGSGTTHRNFVIEDNTITSGQKYGIEVASAVRGLDIRDNVVMQDPAITSTRDRYVPEISVSRGSSDVEITGNTAHEINGSGAGWKIGGNTILKPGGRAPGNNGNTSGREDTGNPDPVPGSGKTIMHDGDRIDGWTKVVARNIDFRDGDIIRLVDYDVGTFTNGNDGNPLEVGDRGRDVTLNSRADVMELIERSDITTLTEGEDTLVLRIAQEEGTVALRLVNLGEVENLL